LHRNINFKLKEKSNLIHLIKNIVREYILHDIFIENPLINHISKTDHSQKNINVNFGASWSKQITKDLILEAIQKKDKKIINYRKEDITTQWLLLVVGGIGDSLYDMDKSLEIVVETCFDKVFILDESIMKLFEIK